MNHASSELNNILRHIAVHHFGLSADFTIDSLFYWKGDDGYQGYIPYYFFDKHGIEDDQYQTSSLHRLVGMHCPGHVVEDFLSHAHRHRLLVEVSGNNTYQQNRPPHTILCVDPPTIGGQTKSGATALHIAVARNSWYVEETTKILIQAYDEEQKRLVERCGGALQSSHEMRSLASIPMSCGTLPLHVVCGMHTTVRRDLLTTLLDADPMAAIRDDCNGDNAFSLLWKNVLQFNWARRMERGDYPIAFIDNCAESLPTWQTIIGKDEYWKYSIIMLRSVLHAKAKRQPKGEGTAESSSSELDIDVDIMAEDQIQLHDIAAIPRCPSLLIRMALASCKFRSQLSEVDADDGMLPLHHAARAEPYTTNYLPFPRAVAVDSDAPSTAAANRENIPPMNGSSDKPATLCLKLQPVLDILCGIYPHAAATFDRNGRLPLHHALLSGKAWDTGVKTLFEAHPEGLCRPDPQTGLFPFMMAAIIGDDNGMEGDEDSGMSGENEEQDAFTTSFLLLKKRPEVIMHGMV